MKAFEKRFNVSPALHSIREARKTKSKVKEDILTPADKDKKATTGALASQIVKDKNTGNKTVASAALPFKVRIEWLQIRQSLQ